MRTLPMLHRLFPLVVGLALCLLPAPALAIDADEMFADPARETRARELGRQLRCVKCRNQSIFDSNAGIAKDLRVVVRERIAAGDSDDEVLAYVVERFGDYVLFKPRITTQTYILWAAPVVFLTLGGLAVVGYHRNKKPSPARAEMSDEDYAEARRILDGEMPS